jgi:hypothetical protein
MVELGANDILPVPHRVARHPAASRDTHDNGRGQAFVLVPDPVYGPRFPHQFLVCARLTRRTQAWGGYLRLFLETSNLTNRTNVYVYDYFRMPTMDGSFRFSCDPAGAFFIVPSLGCSWTGSHQKTALRYCHDPPPGG